MNKKAQKQTINFPLQLNMAKNEPTVDSTFSKADSNNAPLLSEMLNPTYVKEHENKRVYDHFGNSYTIEDGWLTRNGEQLFQVVDKHFERKQFTNLDKYIAWDMHEDRGYGARLLNGIVYVDLLNSDGTVNESDIKHYELYAFGHNIEARIRFVNNEAIFVIIYDDAGTNKIFASNISTDETLVDKVTANWKQFIISYNDGWLSAANYVDPSRASHGGCCVSSSSIDIVNPVINISSIDDVPAFSIVSQFGVAVDSNHLYWITFIPAKNDGEVKYFELGTDMAPDISQTTVTYTPEQYLNVRFTQSKTTTTNQSVAIYTSDNKATWYWYEPNTNNFESFGTVPASVTPTDTGNTASIGGVTYNIYTVSMTRYRFTVAAKAQESTISWKYKFTLDVGSMESAESTATEKTAYWDIYRFSSDSAPSATLSSLDLYWGYDNNDKAWETTPISSAYVGQGYYTSTRYGSATTTTASWATAPNIILDNGNMYSIWRFIQATTAWNNYNVNYPNSIKVSSVLVESATPHVHTYTGGFPAITQFDFTTLEAHTVTANDQCPRNNSFAVNQNMFQITALFNNRSATTVKALADGTTETTGSRFSSYTNNPSIDLTYNPGYSRYSGYNYYGDILSDYSTTGGAAEDNMVFLVGGNRQVIDDKDGNWYMLYNTNLDRSMVTHGISYADSYEDMGTLLTSWDSIDDSNYISATANRVIYKSVNGNYYEIDLVESETNPIFAILDDKYIIVNTTSYANCYDSVNNKIMHYASDYNDRSVFGTSEIHYFQGYDADAKGQLLFGRTTATGINAAYQIQNIAIASMIPSYTTRVRIDTDGITPFNCTIPSIEIDFLGIDVYYSDSNTATSPKYRFTILPYNSISKYTKQSLVNSTWTISSATMLSAALFSEFIYGQGANDMIVTDKYNYPLKYFNTNPFLLYTASSATVSVASTLDETTSDTYGTSEFFSIQGQFYGVVNEKLYSLVYSDGAIAEMDAIVDCKGMKFIGNNTQIAFFWDPQNKVIRSFTGDAILTEIWPASKFNKISGLHFYDETSQQIFIPTDKGLLVIGDKSVYLHSQWKDVSLVQFSTDNVTHITNGNNTIDLVYYPTEGYSTNDIKLETEFFGLGNNELTSIDRWDIILYDISEEHPSVDIKCKVMSINDITTNSDERVYKIKPADYDSYSHSVLVAFNPRLIKAKGLKLFIESPLIIKSITPHIMDDGTGIATKHSV